MIKPELIFIDQSSSCEEDVLTDIISRAGSLDLIDDQNEFLADVYKREQEFSTAIGHGIAIPHAMTVQAKEAFIAFYRSKEPVAWGEEQTPANLIFLIGMPDHEKNKLHLKFLSTICRHLMHEDFRQSLQNCKNEDEAFTYLDQINKSIEKELAPCL